MGRMYFSYFERLCGLREKKDIPIRIQLSRSQKTRNLGFAVRKWRYLRFVAAAAALYYTFSSLFGDELATLESTELPQSVAATYGPLEVSGNLDVGEVWKRQQSRIANGIECPAAPDLPVFMVLTTIPSRVESLVPLVQSLLQQTFPVEILLSIPTEYKRFSPEETERLRELALSPDLTSSERVHILQGDDYGPGTKLLHPLSRLHTEEAYLIAVDDDQVYSPSLACDLLVVGMSYPNKAITRRSRIFPKKHCSNYVTSSLVGEETVKPGQARVLHGSDLVMGTSGYLVKTSFFDESVFAYNECPLGIQESLLFNDDIWFSGHLKRAHIEIVVSLSGFRSSPTYMTGLPEVRRMNNGMNGLWSAKKTKDGDHRRAALNAFFGGFCVPTRNTWRGREDICEFKPRGR